MDVSSRQANAVLVALALAAVGTSGYAVWSARQVPETRSDTVQSAAPTPTSTTAEPTTDIGPDESSETSEDEPEPSEASESEPEGGEDESQEGDVTETSSGPSATAEREPVASVASWESAWSEDAGNLLVIGDEYSHLTSQWVHLWAAQRAADRPTLISHWAEANDESFNEPIELSDDVGPSLHVWSASRDETTIAEATERVERFIEASTPPDAVLLSLGGLSGDEDVAGQLGELLGQLPEVPVLVVAGPADLYPSGVADDIVEWAEDNSDRVALVDLRDATSDNPTAEEWALAFEQAVQDI